VTVSATRRVELADGRVAVAKTGTPAAVAAEVAGLRWLRVPGGPPVPAVLDRAEDRFVMELVPSGAPTRAAAEELGRRLAALHGTGAAAFGAAPPGGPVEAVIGRAPMRNVEGAEWAPWYAEHRVRPYLRLARDAGDLDAGEAGVVERVCARLPALGGPEEPPARLHGDLWSGNVLWSGGRGWLIDPAAHGGHRETDLAMLALFGAPHLDEILRGYTETVPLADGWRSRVPLHQLHPLLVHVCLFGRGYVAQLAAAARAALAS
jgi:fructosamine-3-kinase